MAYPSVSVGATSANKSRRSATSRRLRHATVDDPAVNEPDGMQLMVEVDVRVDVTKLYLVLVLP